MWKRRLGIEMILSIKGQKMTIFDSKANRFFVHFLLCPVKHPEFGEFISSLM